MIQLEALTGHHARSAFDCGAEPLNRWLAQTALQHQTKGISRTFVAVNVDDPVDDSVSEQILGFYALAAGFVLIEELPPSARKKYPRQIPVTRLGHLAVDVSLHGQGLGTLLLADAITRSRSAALAVGSAGIFVDAKGASAARFYASFGFAVCLDDPLKRYLPMW